MDLSNLIPDLSGNINLSSILGGGQVSPDMSPPGITDIPPELSQAITGGGVDLGSLLSGLGGVGNILGRMGVLGGKLQGALTGIPPQDIQLLNQEITSQQLENQTAGLRNNMIQQMFPQFLQNVNAINPSVVNSFADQARNMANTGASFISSATPTLQNAMGLINSATPTLQDAMKFINSATPTIGRGQSFLDMIPGLLDKAQGNISAMTPDIQRLSDQLNMFMNLGDPFYAQRQRQSFEQNSQMYNDYAGQLRQDINQQGMGAAPNGLAASAEENLMSQAGQNASENWLQNLFNSENMSLQATGMFPNVGQLRAAQAGLQSALPQIPTSAAGAETGLAGAQTAQGGAATGVAGAQTGQGQAMTNVGGQQIGQGLGFGQMGQVTSGAGGLALGGQQLQATKAGLLNPLPALPQFPRSPTFVQPSQNISLNNSSSSSGGKKGGGGILGDIVGGIGSIFGL